MFTALVHTTLIVHTIQVCLVSSWLYSVFESTQLRLIDLSLDQLSTNSLLCPLRYDSSPCLSSSVFRLLSFFFFCLFVSYLSSSSVFSSHIFLLLLSFRLLSFFFFCLFVSYLSSSSVFSSPIFLLLSIFSESVPRIYRERERKSNTKERHTAKRWERVNPI